MISVIVPNYNSSLTIIKTLDSLKNQNLPIEIIVVDDCSTDDSVDLVKNNFPQARVIINEKNLGRGATRNIGLKLATKDLILFIDSDVWLSNNALLGLINKMNDCDIVYPRVVFENGNIKSPIKKYKYSYPIDSAVVLLKRERLLGKNIKFDEKFYYSEDLDFFISCYLNGLKAVYIDSVLAIHQDLELAEANSSKYFHDVLGISYGIKKIEINKNRILFNHRFKKSELIKRFFAAVFNYNYFYYSDIGTFKKIKKLFTGYRKFEVSSYSLLKLYFKAVKIIG